MDSKFPEGRDHSRISHEKGPVEDKKSTEPASVSKDGRVWTWKRFTGWKGWTTLAKRFRAFANFIDRIKAERSGEIPGGARGKSGRDIEIGHPVSTREAERTSTAARKALPEGTIKEEIENESLELTTWADTEKGDLTTDTPHVTEEVLDFGGVIVECQRLLNQVNEGSAPADLDKQYTTLEAVARELELTPKQSLEMEGALTELSGEVDEWKALMEDRGATDSVEVDKKLEAEHAPGVTIDDTDAQKEGKIHEDDKPVKGRDRAKTGFRNFKDKRAAHVEVKKKVKDAGLNTKAGVKKEVRKLRDDIIELQAVLNKSGPNSRLDPNFRHKIQTLQNRKALLVEVEGVIGTSKKTKAIYAGTDTMPGLPGLDESLEYLGMRADLHLLSQDYQDVQDSIEKLETGSNIPKEMLEAFVNSKVPELERQLNALQGGEQGNELKKVMMRAEHAMLSEIAEGIPELQSSLTGTGAWNPDWATTAYALEHGAAMSEGKLPRAVSPEQLAEKLYMLAPTEKKEVEGKTIRFVNYTKPLATVLNLLKSENESKSTRALSYLTTLLNCGHYDSLLEDPTSGVKGVINEWIAGPGKNKPEICKQLQNGLVGAAERRKVLTTDLKPATDVTPIEQRFIEAAKADKADERHQLANDLYQSMNMQLLDAVGRVGLTDLSDVKKWGDSIQTLLPLLNSFTNSMTKLVLLPDNMEGVKNLVSVIIEVGTMAYENENAALCTLVLGALGETSVGRLFDKLELSDQDRKAHAQLKTLLAKNSKGLRTMQEDGGDKLVLHIPMFLTDMTFQVEANEDQLERSFGGAADKLPPLFKAQQESAKQMDRSVPLKTDLTPTKTSEMLEKDWSARLDLKSFLLLPGDRTRSMQGMTKMVALSKTMKLTSVQKQSLHKAVAKARYNEISDEANVKGFVKALKKLGLKQVAINFVMNQEIEGLKNEHHELLKELFPEEEFSSSDVLPQLKEILKAMRSEIQLDTKKHIEKAVAEFGKEVRDFQSDLNNLNANQRSKELQRLNDKAKLFEAPKVEKKMDAKTEQAHGFTVDALVLLTKKNQTKKDLGQ